jgi:hypothetical protein
MSILTRKEFEELANKSGSRCISIFLPTHRRGQEVNEHQDEILFKKLLTNIEHEMEERKYGKKEIEEFLEPVKALLKDHLFWHYQSESLAVFVGRTFMKYYHLPISLKPAYYFSHEFYVKPLLPLFIGDGHFYLLALNFHEVKFFKGNRDKLDEIYVKDLVPQQVEEVVGFDYRQKFSSMHSGAGSGKPGIFHGQSHWQEDEKDEILHFFRAIDKSLYPLLEGERAPLVVACLDYLFPLYKKANSYNDLYPEHLSGNPLNLTNEGLHQEAWELLNPFFDRERKHKEELFLQFRDTDRSSTDIKEIIPAAMNGRVDTLFLDNEAEIWGIYDPRTAEVRVNKEQHLSNTSLTNLAAIKVFLNGGSVFLQDRMDMPVHYSAVNALYRY